MTPRIALHALALALAAFTCAGASAQEAPSYDGKWLIKIELDNYRGEADLVIDGKGGSYKRRVRTTSQDPCVGREVPIEILKATADELEYRLLGSQSLKGCPDADIKARRLADGTLDGVALTNGAKMRHVRN